MFLSKTWLPAVVIASALVATNGLAAESPGNASGSVTVNGHATALHHAYAFHDADFKATRVLITNRALDAVVLDETSSGMSSGETPSLAGLTKKGEVTGVELFINPKNEIETVEVFSSAFDMPTPTTGHNFWLEPYRLSGAWVGGRSRTKQPETFFKIVWEYDVTFLTSIGEKTFDIATAAALAAEHQANDAREAARILPAGGGEEGSMYLAYRHNLEARSGKALLDQMTATRKSALSKELSVSPLTDSAIASWAFMESMPPGKVEVVGGTRDTDGTTLELRKSDTGSGNKSFGTARLVKEQGAWKVAGESWR